MKFNLDDFLDGKIAVHCRKEKHARMFLAYLHGLGVTWCDGGSSLGDGYTYWDRNNHQTCYSNQVGYGVGFSSAKWQKAKRRMVVRFTASDLADEIARLDKRLSELTLKNDHQRAQIHNLTLYLGAAIEDVARCARRDLEYDCDVCANVEVAADDAPCRTCLEGRKSPGWQWGGYNQFSGMPGYVERKEEDMLG